MKALKLTGAKQVDIIEIPLEHPGPGQVLLEMKACSICNQHDIRHFDAGIDPEGPGFPGHEGAGVVTELGEGVTELEVGDHVVTTGLGGPPLYREYLIREAPAVAKISSSLSFPSAAPLELFGCVQHSLEWAHQLAGKRICVMGLGPAGLAAVQLLRTFGPLEIIGCDRNPARIDSARSMGADRIINAEELSGLHDITKKDLSDQPLSTIEKKVIEVCREARIDTVIDCTGHPSGLETSCLLAGSEVVVFGYCPAEARALPAAWFEKELVIKNSKILNLENLYTVAALASHKLIDPGQLVSRVMNFTEYAAALEFIKKGEAVKIALTWEK